MYLFCDKTVSTNLNSLRSHLREIKDRSVLRLFESTEVGAPAMLPGGPNVPQPLPQTGGGHWDQDPVMPLNSLKNFNINLRIFTELLQ